ncbi:hypothetical protein L7F22_046864 [Adiantum nelumboides]|nr:hypothetical protein [Adiantum nelumboides]
MKENRRMMQENKEAREAALEDINKSKEFMRKIQEMIDSLQMVLTNDYASLLQVIDDGEVGFFGDGSSSLCDVVNGGNDVNVLISHWFYVFMLDDIREICQETQVKSFQFHGDISDWRDLRLKNEFLDVSKGE